MRPSPGWVADASALLAMVHEEPGADLVAARLSSSAVSAVNWSEVLQKSAQVGVSPDRLETRIRALGLRISPFDVLDARSTARLWTATHARGLSLGDRACLALARRLGLPALTADRTWVGLDVGVTVELVR